jgi:cytokinin dehydrogenase
MTRATWSPSALTELRNQTGIAVLEDPISRASVATDFGGLIQGSVAAVAAPRDPAELEAALRFANEHDLPITIRAGGNSQSGQSVPERGLSLTTSRLDRVGPVGVDEGLIACEAGARWRDVVAATTRHGMLPKTMPLNLDLTIGGTLSAGGFGANSHRFGPTVANVLELTAVTGAGVRVCCNETDSPDFFHALLAGAGRAGVIASARLALRRVQPRVTTFFLYYDELDVWLRDQIGIADRADYLEAFCAGSVMGLRKHGALRIPFSRWSYGMQVSFEHEAGSPPSQEELTERCSGARLLHVEEDDTIEFAARYDSRFAFMRRVGAWQLCHPWLEAVIPLAGASELLPRVLDVLPPFLADGVRVNLLATRALPRFFMAPKGDPALAFSILPVGISPALQQDALNALARVNEMLLAAGGKRYLSGWLGTMDETAWRRHFGDRFDAWTSAKRTFDPNGILGSMLFAGLAEASGTVRST